MSILQTIFNKLLIIIRGYYLILWNCWKDFNIKHRISDDWHIIPFFLKSLIWYGWLIISNQMNYWYSFEKVVQKYPNSNALMFISSALNNDNNEPTFYTENYTYKELYEIILRLSFILINEFNVQPNETVGIDMYNSPLFVFYWFALWNIGAKPAFFNYNVTSDPLIHSMKISEVDKVFIDELTKNSIFFENNEESETFKKLKKTLPNIKFNFVNKELIYSKIMDPNSSKFKSSSSIFKKSIEKSWSSGCYIFTSGTTGLPKAAIMSWRKIDLGTLLYGRIVRIDNKSRVFSSMPLYHSTASVLGLIPTFNQGGCFIIGEKFSASKFWYQVKKTNASHIQYVGEICRYLLNSPINPKVEKNHNVKIAYGNGLRMDIWKEFKERFNILAIGEFFASTESPIATTSFQYGDFGIGACRNYGTIINYILSFQQRLVKMDPDNLEQVYRNPITGLCEEPKINEPGQLLFRIMSIKNFYRDFQGYKNDSKSTNSKIISNVYKKNDCWMLTNDLLKQDEFGLFYFVDRLGDTFRWKSENVSTNEIEIELNKSGYLENAIVVGIKIPGYEGRAGYGILQMNKVNEDEITELLNDKLLNYMIKSLPKYSIPIFLKIVKSYKTTDTHKIIKNYYKNEIFFKDNSDDLIFWLNKNKYQKLTKHDWEGIVNGNVRL